MSKISAIVSAYYCEDLLASRIDNIRENWCDPVIVCQEGSREEEIALHAQAQVITTPDIPTIGKAWNIAIKAADGDLIIVANSDDRFYLGGPIWMASELSKHPEAGLVFSDVNVLKAGIVSQWKRLNNPIGLVPDIAEVLKTRAIVGPMPMWRKSLHEEHGYFDESLVVACDYDWWLRLARAKVGFYYIAKPLGVYALRKDSLEHRNKNIIAEENRKVRNA